MVGRATYAFVSQGRPLEGDLGAGIERALAELQDLGTHIVLLADDPAPHSAAVYECVEAHPENYGACAMPRNHGVQGFGTPALKAAAEALDLDLVDLDAWICPPGPDCPAAIGGSLLHRQGSHLTDTYVRTLTPMLYRALSEIGVAERPIEDIRLRQIPRSHTGG